MLENPVSNKEKFRRVLLCSALGLGSLLGAPMRPEEIEELMHQMNQPKLAHTLPDESHNGDDPLEKLAGAIGRLRDGPGGR